MQPTWSGESAAAVGRAVQGLGNAIGGLGDAFQGEMNQQNEFNANLELLKWDNEQTTNQLKSHAEFNRDNPDGYALEKHTTRTASFNELYSRMPNAKMQQKAQLHFAQRGHNFYETDQKFEYGRRNDMIYRNLDAAITGEFNSPDLSSVEGLPDRVQGKLAGIDAMINSYPGSGSHKEALRKAASDLAINKMREAYTAAKREEEFYPAIKGMFEKWGVNPEQPQPGVPGPQSSAPQVKPRTSGWIPKNVIFHDYGGSPKNADGINNPYHALVFPDGSVRYRNPDDPYGSKAPHAAGMNNVAVGIAYAGQVGSKPTPQALASLQKEYDTVQQMFPGIASGEGHGEAYQRTKGTPQQASRDGRDLIEASWRADMKRGNNAAVAQGGQGPVPMAQRGLTSYAGMSSGDEIAPKLTAYAPQAGGPLAKMEGGYAAAKPGPDGKAEVRTLEDFQTGKSKYITVAGDPGQFGKSYTIPEIAWIDSKGQQQVSKNVTAVVHDTGSAFKGAGSSKFDIPVARDLSNAQMAAQPFLKGGVRFVGAGGKPQQTAAAPTLKGGILTSLDDSPTPEEIKRSGASVLDFDLTKPGAQVALKAAKDAGIKVAAYHEGAGGGASWGEANRDLRSQGELSKLAADAKKLSDQGADYLHLDNLHDMKAGDLAQVAKTVKDATGGRMSVIAKNNPVAWLEVIKANPDLKPAYAVIEHGTKDKVQIEAARQLSELGVPVHFVEFGDPGTDKATGQKRKDPVTTPDEAKAFAQSNPWAGSVVHMRTQDNYNGREIAGGKTFRAENTIPSPNANKVADAGGNVIPMPRTQTTMTQFQEQLQKHMPSYAKEHALSQERWVREQEGLAKEILNLADKGLSADDLMAKLDESVSKKPDLARKAGLDVASDGLRRAVDFQMQNRQLRPKEMEDGIKSLDEYLKSGKATKELSDRRDRLEKLKNEAHSALEDDQLSWADRVGVSKVQRLDWKNPQTVLDRIAAARTVANYYDRPVKFFTKEDREELKNTLKMGGKPMIERLGLLQAAFGADMLPAMAEISKQAPEASTIGWMMTKGHSPQLIEDAATGMERQTRRAMGEKGIAQIKKVEGRQAFIDVTGTAFSRMGHGEGALVETVDAIYEARAARGGWVEPKPDEWKKALREVVGQSTDKGGNTYGGLQTFSGGHKVLLPTNVRNNEDFSGKGTVFQQLMEAVYSVEDLNEPGAIASVIAKGIPMQDTLGQQAERTIPRDLMGPFGHGPSSANGTPLSIAALRRATPISIGDGKYMLAMGDPNGEDPMLVADGPPAQDGKSKPYILDLNMLEKKLKSRRPDLYKGYQQPDFYPSGGAIPGVAVP